MILKDGLSDISLIHSIYFCGITICCYFLSAINFLNIFKENKHIEIYHDYILVPNLWFDKSVRIHFKDIRKIEFYDGRTTNVPPYLVINYGQDMKVGIGSLRMITQEYNQFCHILKSRSQCANSNNAA